MVLEGVDKAQIIRHFKGFGDVADAPWLVLGGGGLKGLAHVGAWRALQEAGVRPAGIIGTSIGALAGALVASGIGYEEADRLARALRRKDIIRVNRRAVWINGIREMSLFDGDTFREYLHEVLLDTDWGSLEMPLLVNAVDLADGSTTWFGTGAREDVSLIDAVYASCALPGFYPPYELNGQAFVDGGTGHPLAIEKASEVGAARVIAVDVGSGQTADLAETMEQGFLGIHQRIFAIMTYRRRRDALERWEGPPLLYVRPKLEGYGPFGFEHIEYFLNEGYRASRETLELLAD